MPAALSDEGAAVSSREWQRLERLSDDKAAYDLRAAFENDPDRHRRLSFSAGDLVVDLSKNLIDVEILDALVELASSGGLYPLHPMQNPPTGLPGGRSDVMVDSQREVSLIGPPTGSSAWTAPEARTGSRIANSSSAADSSGRAPTRAGSSCR